MPDPQPPGSGITAPHPAGSLPEAVRDICQRYERDWQAGTGPAIEMLLDGLPEDLRPIMLRRLLLVEIGRARSAGSVPDLTALRLRFPADRAIVDAVWEASWRTEVPPTAGGWSPASTAALGTAGCETSGPLPADDPLRTRPLPAAPETVTTATRYRDLRPHRRGGMSTLRLAHDEDLDRETVVKSLRQEYEHSELFRRQLLAEASITGKLDHPGIVPVYGIGHDWDGRPFYTMRRISGDDLQTLIERHHAGRSPAATGAATPLDRRDLVEHLVDACNTIAYAHDAGVLHCDLKPQNLMIGRYGETYVVDWGLARPFERATEFRNEPTVGLRPELQTDVKGFTLPFVSPEQFTGRPLGPAADIYSLGATLYYLLTGTVALDGREPDFEKRLTEGRIAPPRSRRPDVPRPLDAICRRAMAPEPAHRYPTAKALAADLQAWLRDEPVAALPERLADRVLRQVRRHSGIVTTAGIAVPVVVCAIAAAALSGQRRQEAENGRAVAEEHERRARGLEQEADAQRQVAEERFDDAVGTFEQIAAPLTIGDWSGLEMFEAVGGRIQRFADRFFAAGPEAGSPWQRGRISELRAIDGSGVDLDDLEAAGTAFAQAREAEPGNPLVGWRLARNALLRGRVLVDRHDDRAEPLLHEAIETITALPGDADGRPITPTDRKLRLADAHHELGRWYLWRRDNQAAGGGPATSVDLFDLARTHFTAALDLREELYDRGTADGSEGGRRTVTGDLARSHGFIGDLDVRQGRLADARGHYERSLRYRRELYESRPSHIDYAFQYARGLANFAELERIRRSDLEQTIARLDEARLIQTKLVGDYRHFTPFHDLVAKDLARSRLALADLRVMMAAGLPENEAAALLDLAAADAAAARKVIEALPDGVTDVDRILRSCRVAEAEALARSNPARAGELARDALAELKPLRLARKLNNPADEWNLALASAVVGDVDESAEALERWVRRGGTSTAQVESRFADEGVLVPIRDRADVQAALKTLRLRFEIE